MLSKLRAIWILLAAFVAPATFAVEPLSTEELAEHCAYYPTDQTGTDAVFCVRYIQGFIDGAVATDERVTKNVSDEYEKRESFTDRAIRTRAPDQRMKRYGATVYAEFCLGAPVPLEEVVLRVIADLSQAEVLTEHALARDAVYTVLRRDYPCQIDSEESA